MPERMGGVDAAWLRMDQPDNTADVVALLAFAEAPPYPDVRRLVEERLLSCQRFRQRPGRAWPFGGDVWEDDPGFSLDHHLVRVRLAGTGDEALREAIGEIATEPLDPSRPLWRVHLLEGPGAHALVAKLHHCLADGFALVSLLLRLADEPPDTTSSHHAMAAYRRLAPWLEPRTFVTTALHPMRAAGLAFDALGMAGALARIAALRPDPPTVLSRPLAGRRRVAWSRGLPLEDVRAGARALGGTVNDVILAAVAGALRGHLAARGERVDALSLRALVPVNLRPGPPSVPGPLGNRFGLVFLDLPVQAATAAARVDAIRTATARMKARPDAVVTFGVLGALGYLKPVQPWATRFFSQKASLVITNVPGPRAHLHLARRRIDHAMFWVPHPVTLGVGVSVLSYAGEVRIGVRADVAVMPEPGDLVRRFEAELDALAPVSSSRAAAASGTPSP